MNYLSHSPVFVSPRASAASRDQIADPPDTDKMDEKFPPSRAIQSHQKGSPSDERLLKNWLRTKQSMRPRMPLTLILAVSSDPDLLQSRSSILRGVGYIVESAISIGEAIDRFEGGDFDLVLLCHSIPHDQRDLLTNMIRHSGSHVPVVCIDSIAGDGRDALADATVNSEPEQLLAAIKQVLLKAGKEHLVSEFADSDSAP